MTGEHFNNATAQREGWFISDCGGYKDLDGLPRPWQLQRDDEASRFEDDKSAWAYVHSLATAGSAYHQSALSFLQRHCPAEYADILKTVSGKSIMEEA
jgi:hypothetical protein